MIVVSDSSPLIYLSWINRLELVRQLFGEVVIPPSVYEEIVVEGNDEPGSLEVKSANWVKIQAPRSLNIPEHLLRELHRGEREAIALSLEVQPTYLIIDEFRGRAVANELAIPIIGVLGIFIIAKNEGLIPNIKDEIEKLVGETTFRISEKVIHTALKLANEE